MALTEGGANPHNRDVAAKMGSLGWLGLSIPESCGVRVAACSRRACLWKRCPMGGHRSVAPVTLIVADTYLKFASEPTKQQVLGGVVAGRGHVDCNV
jgi:alkylation response protein AidB-like acyl-CoA dehydrogenase